MGLGIEVGRSNAGDSLRRFGCKKVPTTVRAALVDNLHVEEISETDEMFEDT